VNTAVSKINHNVAGIVCVIAGTMALGIQDMLIKVLSERYPYPLHQIGLFRSVVALVLVFVFLWLEGGFRQIVTNRLGIHLWRGGLLIIANMAYFLGLSAMPLADAAAVFFSAPLIITLLAIPFLGEKVGPRRWTAIIIGMLGVIIMLRPGEDALRLVALAAVAGCCLLRFDPDSHPQAGHDRQRLGDGVLRAGLLSGILGLVRAGVRFGVGRAWR
jgi:drug/metabolite transporter (DMT)-like permease